MSKYIAIFGDSITWGQDDFECGGWVDRLKVDLMKQRAYNPVFNLGIAGDTSYNLIKRMEVECQARLYPEMKNDNIIIIEIGNNDCRLNNVVAESIEVPVQEYESNIIEIVKIAKKYASTIIFLSIMPCNEEITTPSIWSEKEYFYNSNIDKYNQVIIKVCQQENINFININKEWKDGGYVELLDGDGLHPNCKGHEKIFQSVKDYLGKNKLI